MFDDYNLAWNHKYQCQSKRICHICNFTAGNTEAMKEHVEKYHRRFSCKKCNYHWLDSGMLTHHMQTKHNKIEYILFIYLSFFLKETHKKNITKKCTEIYQALSPIN